MNCQQLLFCRFFFHLFFTFVLVHFLPISGQLVYPKLVKVRACPQPNTWHPSQWQFPVRPRSLAEQLKNNTAAAEVRRSHVRNFSKHGGHGEQQRKRINISCAMIERGDKEKMCSALANVHPSRITHVKKIRMKTNGIFYSNVCLCRKKGGSHCDCWEVRLKGQFLHSLLEMTRKLWKTENMRKLNSCCHDIHVFMPARRQFSVQTGVIWKGVRGIRLDTETAECHRRTDILGGKKQNKNKKKLKEKKRKKGRKKRNLSNKTFLPEKSNTFFLVD